MTESQYKEYEEWANSLGYYLGDNLEYKVKNGMGGIYATSDIPRNSIIYKGDARTIFNQNITRKTRAGVLYLCDFVRSYSKGSDSTIYPMFSTLTPLDELKRTSVYFMSDSDLELLKSFNTTAWVSVMRYRERINRMVSDIHSEIGDSYSKDDTILCVLNFDSRAWSDGGFNPILDLFNHQNKKAMSRIFTKDEMGFLLGARVDYRKGDEVYNSYGISDVYRYAEHYRFFDKNDDTYIDIANRLDFPLNNNIDEQHFEEIKKMFNVQVIQNDAGKKYRILDEVLISKYGPSHTFMKLIDILSRNTDEKIQNPNLVTRMDIMLLCLNWLSMIRNSIKLNINVDSESEVIKMYYDISVAEVEILDNCIQWAMNSDIDSHIPATHDFAINLENQK